MSDNVRNYFETMYWFCMFLTLTCSMLNLTISTLYIIKEQKTIKAEKKYRNVALHISLLSALNSGLVILSIFITGRSLTLTLLWVLCLMSSIKNSKGDYRRLEVLNTMENTSALITEITEILESKQDDNDDN